PTTSTITVALADAYGHPIAGKSVSLAQGGGSSTITTVSGTTNAAGHATFTSKDANVEDVTYTATDTTDSNLGITQTAGVSFTVRAVSPSASTVAASPGSLTANGAATSTVTVTLEDAYGHPVPSKDVPLTQGSGSSRSEERRVGKDAAARATFSDKSTVDEAATYTRQDTSASIEFTA